MLPPKSWVLPEYQASMTRPFLLVFLLFSRSEATTLPSRTTCDQPSAATLASAADNSGAWAASTSIASSRYRYAVACEMPNPRPASATSRRSRNHTSTKTACNQQLNARTPRRVPRARRLAASSPAT